MSNDTFSPQERSRIMSLIKSGDTQPEITLRKALWRKGLRYRLRLPNLPGKPDIVFTRAKVAVFVDGAFWHGRKLTNERFAKWAIWFLGI
jgi:DNA mismatch endonuclease (patch repair protein)